MSWRDHWPWNWRPESFTVIEASERRAPRLAPADEVEAAISAHDKLMERLAATSDPTWSARALWACASDFRPDSHTETGDARLQNGWTDGPDAFCILYTPLFQPELLVGLRRHINDNDPDEYEAEAEPGYPGLVIPMHGDVGPDGRWDPVSFGRNVAYEVRGEPLGALIYRLKHDEHGIGWWGALTSKLPQPPQDTAQGRAPWPEG